MILHHWQNMNDVLFNEEILVIRGSGSSKVSGQEMSS